MKDSDQFQQEHWESGFLIGFALGITFASSISIIIFLYCLNLYN